MTSLIKSSFYRISAFLLFGLFILNANAQNLLTDPSFEAGGGDPAWQMNTAGGRLIDATVAQSGTHSQEITALTWGFPRAVWQTVAVTAGTSYDVSGWLKTDTVLVSTAQIMILWFNAVNPPQNQVPGGFIRIDTVGKLAGTNPWTNLTKTVTAPAGALSAQVYLECTAVVGSSGTAHFDNLSFQAMQGPVLLSPANNAANQPLSLTLSWSAVTGAASYAVEVSTASDFSTLVYLQSGLTSTSQACGGLANSTTYYWRANATKAGGTSAWSAAWSFLTISPTGVPVLLSPANGAVDQPTSLNLSWQAVGGATSYTVQVSIVPNFTSFVFVQSGIASTSQAVNGLANSTKYYWRVNAASGSGTSAWSAVWNFTTIPLPPGVPTLVSPAMNAANVAISPTLTWTAAIRASTYRLEVSTVSDFTSTVFDDSTLTAVSSVVGPLAGNTAYWWRVNAKNAAGTSAWSAVWHFMTVVSPPAVPVLSSPANGAIDQPTSLSLSWGAVSGAATYTLEVSTASDFSTIVFFQSGLTAASQTVSGLANSTIYYWRVDATNGVGTSNWSNVWNFTTAPPSLVRPAAPIVMKILLQKATVYDLSGRVVSRNEALRYRPATSGYYLYKIGDQLRKAASVR